MFVSHGCVIDAAVLFLKFGHENMPSKYLVRAQCTNVPSSIHASNTNWRSATAQCTNDSEPPPQHGHTLLLILQT